MSEPLRLHGLDALRASMMLLGLVLHSAVSFVTFPAAGWPFRAQAQSSICDVLLLSIHLFRMPTFFVMAGFFGALLYERRGSWRGFWKNRLVRVAVPFLVAWPLFWLASVLGIVVGRHLTSGLPFADSWRQVTAGLPAWPPQLMHLWFLYYLVIFYAFAMLVVPVARRLPRDLREGVPETYAWLLASGAGSLIFGAVSGLAMFLTRGPAFENPFVLMIRPQLLIGHGIYFAAGWLLYSVPDVFRALRRQRTAQLAAAALGTLIYLWLLLARPFGASSGVAGMVIAGLTAWCWVLGLIGVATRYFTEASAVWRYLSDASYWIYLIHAPIIIWIAALLQSLAMPAIGQFAITLAVATVLCFLTYHVGVRATVVGQVLNGRRYPRQAHADLRRPASDGA